MENVDWATAYKFRMAALVSAACSFLCVAVAGVYLSASDAPWTIISLGIAIAFAIRSRASAARCTAALAGYSMSPYDALKNWGGTWKILFPPRTVILPPHRQ